MNRGVEILLKRMESNPEEFDYDGWLSGWAKIYSRFEEVLTQEERDAITNKRKEVLRERFEVEIMSKLLGVTAITARKELDEDDMKLIRQCIGDPAKPQIEKIYEPLDPTGGFAE